MKLKISQFQFEFSIWISNWNWKYLNFNLKFKLKFVNWINKYTILYSAIVYIFQTKFAVSQHWWESMVHEVHTHLLDSLATHGLWQMPTNSVCISALWAHSPTFVAIYACDAHLPTSKPPAVHLFSWTNHLLGLVEPIPFP